jgi:hypothetical protein
MREVRFAQRIPKIDKSLRNEFRKLVRAIEEADRR